MIPTPPALTAQEREAVLRSVPLPHLLAELQRRAAARPFTGIPEFTARALVGMYEKDEEFNAVIRVAQAADVAIHYLDRITIESRLGLREDEHLPEDQWRRIADHLDDYDEWLENSGADASIDCFVTEYLPKEAGLARNDEGTALVDVETVDR